MQVGCRGPCFDDPDVPLAEALLVGRLQPRGHQENPTPISGPLKLRFFTGLPDSI